MNTPTIMNAVLEVPIQTISQERQQGIQRYVYAKRLTYMYRSFREVDMLHKMHRI